MLSSEQPEFVGYCKYCGAEMFECGGVVYGRYADYGCQCDCREDEEGQVEKLHWFIVVHDDRVSGRCSDGRTFSEPCHTPSFSKVWCRGFTTALNMSGQTYEMRVENN